MLGDWTQASGLACGGSAVTPRGTVVPIVVVPPAKFGVVPGFSLIEDVVLEIGAGVDPVTEICGLRLVHLLVREPTTAPSATLWASGLLTVPSDFMVAIGWSVTIGSLSRLVPGWLEIAPITSQSLGATGFA